MPWPAKQRTAIFLDLKRRKGENAARSFMHKHGYGDTRKKVVSEEIKKRKKKRRQSS